MNTCRLTVKWNMAVLNIVMERAVSSRHMLKLMSGSANGKIKAEHSRTLQTFGSRFSSFFSFPFVLLVFTHFVFWLNVVPVLKLRLSQVLMCSAVQCVLLSSLPALSWVVFPVLWPSRSWLTSSEKKTIKQGFRYVKQVKVQRTQRAYFVILICCY